MSIKYLVVGAGFSGSVIAERIASQLNQKVLVIDKRSHIAGNAYDCYSSNNVLYHKYGPHYFRTNSLDVILYLSKFTNFIPTKYEIKIWDKHKLYNFPINLNTFEQVTNQEQSEESFLIYLNNNKKDIKNPLNSEDIIVSQIGYELYEKFYKNYTYKQWKKWPAELDSSVCNRIPIRTNRNNAYFNDNFQCLPSLGYTHLIGNILDHPNIKVELNTSLEDIDIEQFTYIFYTGPIDEYFNYEYGELPYRSLYFNHRNFNDIGYDKYVQSAVQVNYPNSFDYTRTVEIKHISKQPTPHSVISYEYPADWSKGKEAYYPIPCNESKVIYEKYRLLSEKLYPKVIFLGRLAKYKYYNMDDVIKIAFHVFNKYVSYK